MFEKEAEEKFSKVDREFIDCQDEGEVFNIGYILGAEPREKQIEQLTYLHNEDVNTIKLLNEQIKTLAQNLEDTEILNKTLTERDKELKAQIEKMKCCSNCRFSESDKLNGTFCHREGCFVVASAKCKLWEN